MTIDNILFPNALNLTHIISLYNLYNKIDRDKLNIALSNMYVQCAKQAYVVDRYYTSYVISIIIIHE